MRPQGGRYRMNTKEVIGATWNEIDFSEMIHHKT